MHKELAAWEAWKKRFSVAEAARDLVLKNVCALICRGGIEICINPAGAVLTDIDSELMSWAFVPAGRDGKIGGKEFFLAQTIDGRRLADDKKFSFLYAKVLRYGRDLGLLILDAEIRI